MVEVVHELVDVGREADDGDGVGLRGGVGDGDHDGTTLWPSTRVTWWPLPLVTVVPLMVMVAPVALAVGVTVAWVTLFATPTAYSVLAASKPVMAVGLTVRSLRVASLWARAGATVPSRKSQAPTASTHHARPG